MQQRPVGAAAAAAAACLFLTAASRAAAEDEPAAYTASHLDAVQVTATRFGEAVQAVPVSMSVVTGEDLRARGARDLRTALALVAGTGVAPGGDAGPAGAVPALLGLREVDDFLLLIDGVPVGGAFTPPFELVSLGNVERIEVLRGAVPVYYGTTAFAGTINVVHYAAGDAQNTAGLTWGSAGSLDFSAAGVLSRGELAQSVSVEASRDRFAPAQTDGVNTGFRRLLGAYRLAAPLAGGRLSVDVQLQSLRQRPGSPSPTGDDGQLRADVPIDFDQNPADARIDTQRQQVVVRWDMPLTFAQWGTTLWIAHTSVDAVQGFLEEGGFGQPGDNASGTHQQRQSHDWFLDTHLTLKPAAVWRVTTGLNLLGGSLRQGSDSFSYAVPSDGTPPVASAFATPGDSASLADRRSFLGAYLQSRVELSDAVSLLAGLRWNRTTETRRTGDGSGPLLDETQRNTRPSGSAGLQWAVWRDPSGDLDDVALYASISNTFQPPQLDFSPDAVSQPLLRAETQRSATIGAKIDGADGRFDVDIGLSMADFANQPVLVPQGGSTVLQSGGQQRFKGIEIESSWRPVANLTLSASASRDDARYRSFTTLIDGDTVDLQGRQLPLTPRVRAALAAVYAPVRGAGFSVTASHTGRRFLDAQNAAAVPGFTVLDASLTWGASFGRFTLGASNLGDRRDAVLASEAGEGQFYRLPGRRVFLAFEAPIS